MIFTNKSQKTLQQNRRVKIFIIYSPENNIIISSRELDKKLFYILDIICLKLPIEGYPSNLGVPINIAIMHRSGLVGERR